MICFAASNSWQYKFLEIMCVYLAALLSEWERHTWLFWPGLLAWDLIIQCVYCVHHLVQAFSMGHLPCAGMGRWGPYLPGGTGFPFLDRCAEPFISGCVVLPLLLYSSNPAGITHAPG